MDHKIHLDEPSVLDEWIINDLRTSRLTVDYFGIEVLTSDTELKNRLGFTHFGKESILEVRGYWIPYPNVPGYYRLKLKKQIEGAKYLSPSKEKGFGVHPYILPEVHALLKTYSPDKPIFITEGEKKAAKMTLSGFPCIGIPGVWNWNEIESDFLPDQAGLVWKDRKAYVVFDSDIVEKHGVRHAELRLAIERLNKGATVYSVRLPNEPDGQKNGADDYLVKYGSEAFKGLVEAAKPTLELHVSEGPDTRRILTELPRLQNEILKAQVLKAVAKREGVSLDVVQKEYQKCLPSKEGAKESPGDTFTDDQIQEAEVLLKSPDILDRMTVFNAERGYIGEVLNQRLLYLACTSRLMDEAINVVVKGESSSGKSHLVETVLSLFPEKDVWKFSYVSAKALFHLEGDLSHKILSIAEHVGGQDADYTSRTGMSEGEASSLTAQKNEKTGTLETVQKRTLMTGTVQITTTTRDRIHDENETRVIDLYTDESQQQTERILRAQAARAKTSKPKAEKSGAEVWRRAQGVLKPYQVVIPYADKLYEGFPTAKARARRDFPKLLTLIKAHTLLYQYQREMDEEGSLISTAEDFEAVLPLVNEVLAQTMRDITPSQEAVLKAVVEHYPDDWFSVGDVCRIEGTPSRATVKRNLREFVKRGFLDWNGLKGGQGKYRLLYTHEPMSQGGIFSPNLLESLKSPGSNTNEPRRANEPANHESEPSPGSPLAHAGSNANEPGNLNIEGCLRQNKASRLHGSPVSKGAYVSKGAGIEAFSPDEIEKAIDEYLGVSE